MNTEFISSWKRTLRIRYSTAEFHNSVLLLQGQGTEEKLNLLYFMWEIKS